MRALEPKCANVESSTSKTSQYLAFHRTFKHEFTTFLKELGYTDIEVCKPNHFAVSGFFRNQKGQLYYFSISDLRWSKETMLIRTAAHNQDWTGGTNRFVSLTDLPSFKRELLAVLDIS